MRIVIHSGWARGLTLRSGEESHTRPTASRVREAVCSSLGDFIQGADVLDLFAGFGGVGIETLSRGASSLVSVENNRQSLACLRQNIKDLESRAKKQNIAISSRVVAANVEDFIKQGSDDSYDLIWLDPPYALVAKFWQDLHIKLKRLVRAGGKIVLESDKKTAQWLLEETLGLLPYKQARYGQTVVSYYDVEK